jgi:hypothetical protein
MSGHNLESYAQWFHIVRRIFASGAANFPSRVLLANSGGLT